MIRFAHSSKQKVNLSAERQSSELKSSKKKLFDKAAMSARLKLIGFSCEKLIKSFRLNYSLFPCRLIRWMSSLGLRTAFFVRHIAGLLFASSHANKNILIFAGVRWCVPIKHWWLNILCLTVRKKLLLCGEWIHAFMHADGKAVFCLRGFSGNGLKNGCKCWSCSIELLSELFNSSAWKGFDEVSTSFF